MNPVTTDGTQPCIVPGSSWPTSLAEFTAMINRHEPTVFKGLASSWLPVDISNSTAVLDWLVESAGDSIVPVSIGLPSDKGFLGTSDIRAGKSIPTTLSGSRSLHRVVEDMKRELQFPTGHALYMQSIEVKRFMGWLAPYLALPLVDCPHTEGHWRFWMGTGDHRVNLHYDGDENFFCMLAGRKRFSLAPFEIMSDIYMGPLNGPYGPPASIVDPINPNLNAFPRFADARKSFHVVELEPGDVLYVPAHWWHYVESLGLNIAANFWWKDIGHTEQAEADLVFLKALLATRSLPLHWRRFWRAMFDHFVFMLQGDPYSHLPTEAQGIAGAPTKERLAEISEAIRAQQEELDKPTVADAPLAQLPRHTLFQLGPAVTCRPVSSSKLAVRDDTRGLELQTDLQMMAVLAQFAQPQSVEYVLSSLADGGLDSETFRVSQALTALIEQRFVVPCG